MKIKLAEFLVGAWMGLEMDYDELSMIGSGVWQQINDTTFHVLVPNGKYVLHMEGEGENCYLTADFYRVTNFTSPENRGVIGPELDAAALLLEKLRGA